MVGSVCVNGYYHPHVRDCLPLQVDLARFSCDPRNVKTRNSKIIQFSVAQPVQFPDRLTLAFKAGDGATDILKHFNYPFGDLYLFNLAEKSTKKV